MEAWGQVFSRNCAQNFTDGIGKGFFSSTTLPPSSSPPSASSAVSLASGLRDKGRDGGQEGVIGETLRGASSQGQTFSEFDRSHLQIPTDISRGKGSTLREICIEKCSFLLATATVGASEACPRVHMVTPLPGMDDYSNMVFVIIPHTCRKAQAAVPGMPCSAVSLSRRSEWRQRSTVARHLSRQVGTPSALQPLNTLGVAFLGNWAVVRVTAHIFNVYFI